MRTEPTCGRAAPAFLPPCAAALLAVWSAAAAAQPQADTAAQPQADQADIEQVTIVGSVEAQRQITGAAQAITAAELTRYQYTDIQRIIRQLPGVAVQIEDGFGLRPNLSIRGTASDRSGRITLLEDNVLIAPAPYAAPAAYYFPTTARMHQLEVLKGPSAITQGPYTVGGAINLVSTPIPNEASGFVNLSTAQFGTARLQAHYGASGDHFGWLAETHLWNSDGYQTIDRAGGDTGLDKDDWMLKFRVNSDRGAGVYHELEVKLQYATEHSEQSYLGLTDADFGRDAYRRYAVSQLDDMDTRHDQVIARYRAELSDTVAFKATVYANGHERAWFKTEAFDGDGSAGVESFAGTSWSNVILAVNRGESAAGLGPDALAAVLGGADTVAGSIQLRNNAREYYSRGVQLGAELDFGSENVRHGLEIGLRLHEDQEDRLQRNSNYHLDDGAMILDDLGLLGNAGNRIVDAEGTALHVYDRIRWRDWVFTPGLRYEDMTLSRIDYETRPAQTSDPSSRAPDNLRGTQQNSLDVWIPGVGVLRKLNDRLNVFGGVHKGFSAPGSSPGAREEESTNYEAGLRATLGRADVDVTAFRTDYDNLLGVCTVSSSVNCEVGDAFNGDAATIDGLELSFRRELARSAGYSLPFMLTYTHMSSAFDSDIADTEFFGDVSAGDPIPYIPENELFVSIGVERGRFSTFLNASYVDEVCVRASCGPFEKTEDAVFLDAAAHFRVSDDLTLYAQVENLAGEDAIMGRQPYGARPNKDRMAGLGVRLTF
jgi:Fe(3+) dicitrate transport protein